jgi:hypothetical protein
VATATRVARSTIGRGLAELRLGRDDLGSRVRRPGGGRKPAVETQPGLLEALSELVQSAIRGDPEAALLQPLLETPSTTSLEWDGLGECLTRSKRLPSIADIAESCHLSLIAPARAVSHFQIGAP